MFSSMLQSLLSSSGQANAMQRAVQMNNYINKYNDQWTPVEKASNQPITKEVQSFDKVLKNLTFVKLTLWNVKTISAIITGNYVSGAYLYDCFTFKYIYQG